MALVNPNIALSVRPVELASPLEQYGKIAALQSAQNQNALAQYQLGAAQRSEATQNALNSAYAQSVDPATGAINYNKLTGLLASGGGASQIPAIEKTRRELETAALTKKKTEQDIETGAITQQKMQADLLGVKLKQSREFLDTIDPAAPDAPQRYLAWHEANHRDPVIGAALNAQGVSAEQARQSIMNAVNQGPQAFADLLLRSKLGTEKFMAMNAPQVVAPGSTLVQGGKPVFTAPERQDTDLIRNFNAAVAQGFKGNLFDYERRIKEAGRTPAQAPQPSAPVAVVDPTTGKQVLVSREEALRNRMTPAAAMESLPPKEIQKREAAFPQATASVKGFETKSTAFIKDLEALRNHPGLSSITGIAAGRLPGLTADGRAAQALYDKVVAKGGFQALQDMRDASKTGGALGNVSNQEGKQLTASFAAIDRRQDAKDVQAAIDQAIADIQGSRTRMREAYDSTYSYKSGGEAAAPALDVRSQADAILKGGK